MGFTTGKELVNATIKTFMKSRAMGTVIALSVSFAN